jgi:hypothetical protein
VVDGNQHLPEEPIAAPVIGGGGSAPSAPNVGNLSLSDVAACQLAETENYSGAVPKGFPHWTYMATADVVRVAMIPVDFSNALGNPALIAGFVNDAQRVEDWSANFARGKMRYQVQYAATSWIRAPKEGQ